MRQGLLVALLAAAGSAGGALLTWRLARLLGAVDDPAPARKVHDRGMPRLGGLAIGGGVVLALAVGALGGWPGASRVFSFPPPLVGLGAAGILVALVGLLDDVYELGPLAKLAGQVAAGSLAWAAGFRLETVVLGPTRWELGPLALPATVLWFVAVMNAVNLVDGLDGLAASLALLAVLVFGVQAVRDGGAVAATVAWAIGGALVGFLAHNVHPARQFMGSTGSLLLGLLLAALSLGTLRGRVGWDPLVALPALGVPLLDLVLAFARRVLRGTSPFRADREHLHHRLLDAGRGQGRAVAILAAVQAGFAACALAALFLPPRVRPVAALPALVLAVAVPLRLRGAGGGEGAGR